MKIRNKVLPGLALAGMVFALLVALRTGWPPAATVPAAMPAQAPYQSYIGGAGLIEASSTNVSAATPTPGVVARVFVQAGDTVTSGDPLFQLDSRAAQATLNEKETSLAKAVAALAEAKASLKDYRTQFEIVRTVTDSRAVSKDEVEKRRNALALAEAKTESAKAAQAMAQAEVDSARTSLDLLTVRSPMDCEVLQVNVRPGEFASTGALSTPLMRLGDMDRISVRVDIDENDAWRFVKGSQAMAFLRGNRDRRAALTFERVEPYVVPKTSLTGSSTERVDTRVLQVVYTMDAHALPVFVGQQVDVFIETSKGAQMAQECQPDRAGRQENGL